MNTDRDLQDSLKRLTFEQQHEKLPVHLDDVLRPETVSGIKVLREAAGDERVHEGATHRYMQRFRRVE